MGFEIFDSKSVQRRTGIPTIAFRLGGSIRINRKAYDLLKQGGAECVLILWDKENRKVGISAAPKTDARAYRLTPHKSAGSATIGSKTFAKFIGLKPGKTAKLFATYHDKMLKADVPADYLQSASGRAGAPKVKTRS